MLGRCLQDHERQFRLQMSRGGRPERAITAKGIDVQPPTRTGQGACQGVGRVAPGQRLDLGAPLGRAAPALGRAQVDQDAAPNRAAR